MNLVDLFLDLADLPLIGMLAGLLLWFIAAVILLFFVELAIFLRLTIRAMRSTHLTAGKPVIGKS